MGIWKTDGKRPGSSRRHRLALGLAAALLGAGVGAVPATAQSTTGSGNVVTLEVAAYKITNRVLGAGGSIPRGTVLTPVVLRTADPDAGPLPTGAYIDPIRLDIGETVTISVDGTTVATTFPGSRGVALTTSQGNVTATVFSAGRDSYAIPKGAVVSGPVTVTARAKVASFSRGLDAQFWGLLPPAAPVAGSVLVESLGGGGDVSSIRVAGTVLYDADGVRGTNPGEEWVVTRAPFLHTEVRAVVEFRDGSVAAVLGIQRVTFGPFALGTRVHLLDTAGLGGRSLADISAVLATVPTDHDLNWSDLGFPG